MLNNWVLCTSCSGIKNRIPVFLSITVIDSDRFSTYFYWQTNKVILKITSNRKHVATLPLNWTFYFKCILRQKKIPECRSRKVCLITKCCLLINFRFRWVLHKELRYSTRARKARVACFDCRQKFCVVGKLMWTAGMATKNGDSSRSSSKSDYWLFLDRQEAQLMLTNPRDAFTPGMVSY